MHAEGVWERVCVCERERESYNKGTSKPVRSYLTQTPIHGRSYTYNPSKEPKM